MGSELHDAAAQGFPGAATAYDEGRPTYPPKAVARLARGAALRSGRAVLDLAAGTGKLTALLVGTGAEVVAVEPVEEMRAVLGPRSPACGPCPAPPRRSHSRPARSTRSPRPGVSLVQRRRGARRRSTASSVPGAGSGCSGTSATPPCRWVARLSELMEPHRGDAPSHSSGVWREAFERTALFGAARPCGGPARHRLAPEGVVARVASVSFVAALPEAERESVLCEVRRLLGADPGTRGREELELPYRTEVSGLLRLAALDDLQAPRLPALEELVRVDLAEPTEEVALRVGVGGAVDGGALGRDSSAAPRSARSRSANRSSAAGPSA